MKAKFSRSTALAALLVALTPLTAVAADYRPIAPENELYLKLETGMVIVEMHPEIAPGHVARVKKLAHEHFYDGQIFHGVIEAFMAQGGDPTGTGQGGSEEPDLKAEFTFHNPNTAPKLGLAAGSETLSVAGGAVTLTEPETNQFARPDGMLRTYVPYCRGVIGAARTQDPNSANSQFFIMFGNDSRSLDHEYTVWGNVVYGMDAVDKIARGEPPRKPTKILWARVGSDVPASERKVLEAAGPDSKALQDTVNKARAAAGGAPDACAISVPVRVVQGR